MTVTATGQVKRTHRGRYHPWRLINVLRRPIYWGGVDGRHEPDEKSCRCLRRCRVGIGAAWNACGSGLPPRNPQRCDLHGRRPLEPGHAFHACAKRRAQRVRRASRSQSRRLRPGHVQLRRQIWRKLRRCTGLDQRSSKHISWNSLRASDDACSLDPAGRSNAGAARHCRACRDPECERFGGPAWNSEPPQSDPFDPGPADSDRGALESSRDEQRAALRTPANLRLRGGSRCHHFGFHSRPSLCASVICSGVILAPTASR